MKLQRTVIELVLAALISVSTASHAAILSLTDGASNPTAKTYAFTVSTPGLFLAALDDLKFPESFQFLSLAVAPKGGAAPLGSILAPGTFSFEASTAGDYLALLAARPGATTGFGFYSINITQLGTAPVPEPQVWMLMLGGIGLIGWLRLRNVVG